MKISNSSHFPIQTAIIVPSTNKKQKEISEAAFDKRITEVRKALSKMHGGYTSVTGIGGYYSKDKKKVITENVVVVTSYAEKFNKARFVRYVRKLAKQYGQESIGIIYETDLYQVKP